MYIYLISMHIYIFISSGRYIWKKNQNSQSVIYLCMKRHKLWKFVILSRGDVGNTYGGRGPDGFFLYHKQPSPPGSDVLLTRAAALLDRELMLAGGLWQCNYWTTAGFRDMNYSPGIPLFFNKSPLFTCIFRRCTIYVGRKYYVK